MKYIAIMLLALAVSLPAMAGGADCDGSAEEVARMETKLANKAWLGVEYDKTDGQYTITKVHADSPADRAGFEKGDVLLTMEGVEYTKANKKALKKVYAKIEPGSDVQYVVKRGADAVELNATLSHVPVDLQKKWLAEHMQKYHPDVQVASSN